MRHKPFNPVADLRSHLSKIDNCKSHPPLRKPSSIEEAEMWRDTVERCDPGSRREHLRWLCLNDLFFLSVFVLHRWHFLGDKIPFEPNEASNLREARHADRDERKATWCWERCREYEADPWNRLDIWAREHFKCIRKGSLVTLADGQRRAVEELKIGERVMSIDSNGRATVAVITSVASNGVRPVRRFRTKSGRTFEITENHRMLGPDGTWPTGAELREGRWVALPRYVEREPRETLSVQECAYLGFMMSDGAITQSKAIFTNFDQPVIDCFISIARACGFTADHRPQQGYVAVQGALGFQRKMGVQGGKAIHKRVPQELFHQPNAHLWVFLGAFFDCDGWVNEHSNQAGITLANAGLIDDLRHICDLLGVFSRVSKHYDNGHAGMSMLIIGEQASVKRLWALMPLAHGDKKAALERLAHRNLDHNRGDPIPKGWERLLTTRRRSRIFRNAGVCYPHPPPDWLSRSKVQRFADIDGSRDLQAYLRADVRWDRVDSVADPVEAETFDLQVDGTQTYHLNGVISHNTEIITFAANIQSIIKDPNETIGLFSHTRPIAKGFLRQIKSEFENNSDLKDDLFPDIFYTDPRHQAPHWGDDVGIFVKRQSNRKEATVEAWGLIDGQPISKRFTILSYDDVVSRKEISEYMVPVATQEFRNSLFLTASDPMRFRYCATFQEVNDTTQQLMETGMKTRIRPAVDAQNQALCLSDEKMSWFNNNLTPKEIALQLLMDPKKAQGEHQLGFRQEWVQYYERNETSINSLNKFIFVDPAGATNSNSRSHYCMAVVGLSPDGRYKWLDAVYDKLNLEDRTKALKEAVTTWHPLRIFYEKQSFQSDIEHIRGEMRRELWETEIVEVGTNQMTKDQRIEMLLPVFSTGLFQMPKEGIRYVLQSPDVANELKLPEHAEINVVKVFLEQEYLRWPWGVHRDMLDALSYLKWMPIQNYLTWPRKYGDPSMQTGSYGIGDMTGGSWMSD